MNIIEMDINNVKPYDKNPRNNDDAVEATANSIKEFGWQQPIVVDHENVIIVGHTRLRAAKLLKLDKVPVVVADNLTDEQVKAYRLADNKTGELAIWDDKLLSQELDDILNIDMQTFGFDLTEDSIEDEIDKVEGDIPVADQLDKENNYVVLKFDSTIDWLQAQTFFNLQTVKWAKRSKVPHKGVGRVIDGSAFIKNCIERGINFND